ncbi:MAG TPA: glucoamylase family protein [Balneolaceae bacterium]
MPEETQIHYKKQHLEREIRQLAQIQRTTLEEKPLVPAESVLGKANETLTETYRKLARAAKKNRELTTAGEWLIDNFYIIQEQIVQLKEDLPPSYYKRLPRATRGEFTGFPRIYEIVQILTAVTDNLIDQDNTTVAIKAYQEKETLSLGEMWAVPLMVRLALIVRLAERGEKLIRDRRIFEEVNEILEVHLNPDVEEPGYLLRKLSEIVDQQHDTERFLAILAQRLQTMGMLTENERRWFDYKFARWETNLDEQLRGRTRQTSRLHLSIQNAISSLRKVSETDWSNFVETCSVVEQILRLDPANVYASMDFQSRDAYRKKIEKLSDHSHLSQQQIAEEALIMAEGAAKDGAGNEQKTHIGYYLLGRGYDDLCIKVSYQTPVYEQFLNRIKHHFSDYIGFICLTTFILLLIVALVSNLFSAPAWLILISVLAALLPAFDLATITANRLISLLVPPDILPKVEFKNRISDRFRTLVVVPTIFSSQKDIKEQMEMLEIRALANSDPALQFALLSDFPDAAEETLPEDEAFLQTARKKIDQLNNRYQSTYGDKFLLFHRHRSLNENDNIWMGWERKRGKIEELNRVLKNPDAEATFYPLNQKFLASLRHHPVTFVITLDADTKLPPGSSKKLIGTAAHPLNRPLISKEGNYVSEGYGIFQPRISIAPQSANRTWFTQIFSGNVGLDPYTTAVSDIYQDLYREGVFVGKGLYDLNAFEDVLGDRFPSNIILSHDLLESTYLRSALVTDIELFDNYPTTYLSYCKRNHRWIRGDWQIMPWLFNKAPGSDGKKEKNPINPVSKWKIFDNLRRSLNPPALILFLLLGWLLLPGSALIWTAAVFGVSAFPIYSSFSTDIFRRNRRVRWQLHLEKMLADLKMNTIQACSTFIFLPHQAWLSLDAISRTLWRRFISHKKMLEWTTSIQAEKETGRSQAVYWKKMWFNIFWAVLSVVLVSVFTPSILIIAIPISLAWISAPAVAFRMSRKPERKEKVLHVRDRAELKLYARRTWHFFEQYMNEEQNWLPPDNVQQDPYIGATARTSPTNMGLSLVAVYAAYERGYITFSAMVELLSKSLNSMQKLSRYRGHFYNWYSTQDGRVLHPRYLSTVDSGNMAASLIVMQEALEQLPEERLFKPVFWSGLRETMAVIDELVDEFEQSSGYPSLFKQISSALDSLKSSIPAESPAEISNWEETLNSLRHEALKLSQIDVSDLQDEMENAVLNEWQDWLKRPLLQIESHLKELEEIEKSGASYPLETELKDLKAIPFFEEKLNQCHHLAALCQSLVQKMDFNLFYNAKRKLFSIGFNEDRAALDNSFYDLLASEARLASFIAIAKGDVPSAHWFKLSRRLTSIRRNEILLSWSGTMFEYLMPLLFMGRFEKTLLSNTYDHVVEWQKNYGKLRSHPWGFSESAYNVVNLDLHYQYKAFGVPGLGLRRGLAEDYVVAPYASLLALMVDPADALPNLRDLKKAGVYSMNGFYEAIDYSSPSMEEDGEDKRQVVKMYMAHHQAMGLLALSNVLNDNLIQRLFHDHPLVKSCELLLQEKIPRGIPIKEPRPIDIELEPAEEETGQVTVDYSGINNLDNNPPRTHLLSNGRFSMLITNTGTGYSSFEDISLSRWRADGVKDPYGFFFYLKDLETQEYWSVGHQPVVQKADRYDVWFHAGKVQIARVNNWIESFMEVCVSPEDDIEFRKVILTNYSNRPRKIELTSYAEVVLDTYQSDRSHPAFSKLFVQTEYLQEQHALLARRRLRNSDEKPVWLAHTIVSDDIEDMESSLQFETDRAKFIGRARSPASPQAMDRGKRLSGSVGNVPDPVVSLRRTITLKPGEKKQVTFGLGRAESREEAIEMAGRYDNTYATDRVFELAAIYGGVELDHIGMSGDQAHYFQKLAGSMLYGNESLRAKQSIMKRNRRTQSALWAHGISGDLPLLVYHISDGNYIREVAQLLKGHALWRQKGLKVDLVIINEHPPSYIDELQEAIQHEIQLSLERQQLNTQGGVFVLRADQLDPEVRTLIDTVAYAVLNEKLPNLDDQSEKSEEEEREIVRNYEPVVLSEHHKEEIPDTDDLLFFNGYGGFTQNGKEYVIKLQMDEDGKQLVHPPAPWINVIANDEFGFITTDNGSDHTWSKNSRENKLTPWSNDEVMDPTGEALFIRDEEEGLFWSPSPGPVAGSVNYEVRHGFGYTDCRSETLNIEQQVIKWVAVDEPIKIIKLRLTNTDLRTKKLSVFRYLEWVLGVFRENSGRQVITDFNDDLQSVFARNYYNNEFAGRVAFASFFTEHELNRESYTGDRMEFIGRNNSLSDPQALHSAEVLNEQFGMGFDSCAASKAEFSLDSGSVIDFYFFLGETQTREEAKKLIQKYRDASVISSSLDEVKTFWDKKLGRIQINTPVEEFDILVNGWLQYQNIGCRIWARTGFYQSGGAYGFRDQLQDSTAACYLDPDLTRKQILLHSAHQFPEGDVLHWWHPPMGRGIRSRISDDLLWMPYATAFYLRHTGDDSILSETTNFINARTLEDGEHEAYLHPQRTDEPATLYEHCCRAIDRSLTKGPHNLPLIGTGDWNDGMNNVGDQGKGESIWLGFFLYDILDSFIPICEERNDERRLETYREYQKELKKHLNDEGWDGEWFRRAYYDDETPLGSKENEECRIDAIAQAWSVISGAADVEKGPRALESANRHLISEDDGIIRLLTPAFDTTDHNPGYIKGYIPGVRENGGQYTHGALWLVKAFAENGNRERAAELMRMLTPINHARDHKNADQYMVEPYAVAADIYGEPPLTGMGGWTWYTGSAGWMYRVILESILGVEIRDGNHMHITPYKKWKYYRVILKDFEGNTTYDVKVQNNVSSNKEPEGKAEVILDGVEVTVENGSAIFPMKSDGKQHQLLVKIESDEK